MDESEDGTRVWYLAYGSNLAAARFCCYLRGGRPEGGQRDYVGCDDDRDPIDVVAVEAPGQIVFAGTSRVWGGGMALYDGAAAGSVAGRAYLLRLGQFADVVAQEMWQEPGGDLARRVTDVVPTIETIHVLGPGRYEALHRLGERDGYPMFTMTADDPAALGLAAPSPAYLHWIVAGLHESHGWGAGVIVDYLARSPGVLPTWTVDGLQDLVVDAVG